MNIFIYVLPISLLYIYIFSSLVHSTSLYEEQDSMLIKRMESEIHT